MHDEYGLEPAVTSWNAAQWVFYGGLVVVALLVTVAALAVAVEAASVIGSARHDTATVVMVALGAAVVTVLGIWWSWTRFSTIYRHVENGNDGFFIGLGLAALAVAICAIAAGALQISAPRPVWIGGLVAIVVVAIGSFINVALERLAAFLGVGVGAVVLVGILGAFALMSNN